MRYILFLAIVFTFSFSNAQTSLFTEDFESLPLNFTSSGSGNWARSSQLQKGGTYSDTATIIANGDTTYLTSNAFSTVGNNYVILQFEHICKFSFNDGGYIEVSNDNGLSWIRVTSPYYHGQGQFANLSNRFNAVSYSTVWDPINNGAIPTNNWWRKEIFDLSTFLANTTQAKIRFIIADGDNTGALGNYGWLLDDIEVLGSANELSPPSISLQIPYPQDTIFNTGPFDVYADITDSSGIASAKIVYEIAGISDTVDMIAQGGSLYKGTIPSQAYNTSICYHLIATDASANSNFSHVPSPNCIEIITKLDPNAPIPNHYDVAMESILSPTATILSNTTIPIDIRLKNKGDSILNKATIDWELDGISQSSQIFNGSLSFDLVTNTINLDSLSFATGSHLLKVWASLPNDSIDQNPLNDTITLPFYACSSILNGNYTLGGANADFVDFTDLTNALSSCGINGPTTIIVNAGTYAEQVLFSNIPGLDSTNNLTIISSTNDANDVLIKFTPTIADNYVLGFDNVSWIKLKHIGIESIGTVYATSVKVFNSSSHLEFDHCNIKTPSGNNYFADAITFEGIGVNYNTVSNCRIDGGMNGIEFYGSSVDPQTNNLAINNEVINVQSQSIYAYNNINVAFLNNKVSSITNGATTALMGLRLFGCDDYSIQNNTVSLEINNSAYGISISQSSNTLANPNSIIANNMVSVTGSSNSSSVYGFFCANTSNTDIYYNSVAIHAGGGTSRALYFSLSSTGNNVKNNIFSHFSGGYAIENAAAAIGIINYNNYFTSGLLLGKWGSNTAQASVGISAIQALSGQDVNSLVTNPDFYTPTNLHTPSPILNNIGTPLSIATDIDGHPRNTTTPDIGADEYSISSLDVGVVDLLNVFVTDTQSRIAPLEAIIKNFGSSTVSTLNVKYVLDGSSPLSFAWTGTLAPGQTDTISLGNMTIPVLNFSLTAFTEMTGDTLNYNDSLSVNYYGLPLIEAEITNIDKPVDGCDKGTAESIEIEITNNGVGSITNGLTASYQIIGSPIIVSESINTPIAAGASLSYTFTQTADLSVGLSDSLFQFMFAVNHSSDPKNTNDTINGSALSIAFLDSPIINDTTISYSDSVTLTAISNDPLFWYDNDSTTLSIATGSSFTTPQLFDTTTYYVQAGNNIPSVTAHVGLATTTYGYFDDAIYGGNMGSGRYQMIFTAAELSSVGLTAGVIESIAFNAQSSFTAPTVSFDVSMANVTATSLGTTFLTDPLTSVFSGQFIGQAGWNTHTLTGAFTWDGVSSLLIQVCNVGNSFNSPQMYYTATTVNKYVGESGGFASCSSTIGSNSTGRPNIRIITKGVLGCTSLRVPVTVNVPLPAIDGRVAAIVDPISGCGLANSPVTIDIVNMGTDTIPSGYNITYRVDNGAYITPETITTPLFPEDTMRYTFATLANLPAGSNGTNYLITAKVNISQDTYSDNDSLVSDTIFSDYTPGNPIIANQTINYGSSAILSATASDTVYWYSDPLGTQLSGIGNNFITNPLYDTTTFYAKTQKTIANTNYNLGLGTAVSGPAGPSPYGAGAYGARTQYLITAAEMQAMGMIQGPIYSISFDIYSPTSIPLQNYHMRIGHTSKSAMSGNAFEDNLSSVYSSLTYSDYFGWNDHTLIAPFYWDGSSNIILETCFKNISSVAYSGAHYTITSYNSVGYSRGNASFDCSDTAMFYTSNKRPNIRLNQTGLGACESDIVPLTVNIQNFASIDAGITAIVEPDANASSIIPTSVKVVLKNYGSNTINSATINWSENGTNQSAYSWTGSLSQQQTDTVTIATSHLLKGGSTEFKAWVNVIGDVVAVNDTASVNHVYCMSGNYVINQVSGDYSSFTNAIADLELAGICGPVVFNVDSGLYAEQVILHDIIGSSATNTITFQSTQSDSSAVTMQYFTTANDNYIFKIEGASNIILKHLGMISTGSQYANLIELSDETQNIEIKNNYFLSSTTSIYQSEASAVYSQNELVSDIMISGNRIQNSYNAFQLEGGNKGSISIIEIKNNIIESYSNSAIRSLYADSIFIEENQITSGNQGTTVYGIYLHNVNHYGISKNKLEINSADISIGMYVSADGTSNNPSSISNNFVSINTGMGLNYGLRLNFCDYVDVSYNSFYINSGSTNSRALALSNGSNLDIRNNNIASKAGYLLHASTIPPSTSCDYNNLYIYPNTSSNFAWWSTAVNDLSALQILDINNNQNSLSNDPLYYSVNDLHAQSIDLYNSGTPIASITTDIDNETRSTTSPSIGADEFLPLSIDIGVNDIPYPSISACGYQSSDSLVVSIRNFGLNSIDFSSTNATITLIVGGISNDTLTFVLNSGILTSGQIQNIKLSNNYDLSLNGVYTLNASILMAGDLNSSNDILAQTSIISYPNINTFPFSEDFESNANLSFIENDDLESDVEISGSAGVLGSLGLHFQGGNSSGWTNPQNVTSAFAISSHIATARTCNVDATLYSTLQLQFDLKQTKNTTQSYADNDSWFRVLLIDANNITHYLKNSVGDSVFKPVTANSDPFTTHTFNLGIYTGQNFQISFESSCKYAYGYGTFSGDNAFLDNVSIWSPNPVDISIRSVYSDHLFGKFGDPIVISTSFMNLGTDTLYNIPLAYQVDNGVILRDTAIGIFLPSQTDNFNFSTTHTLTSGIQTVCVFAEVPNDGVSFNDSLCVDYKGLETFTINYTDDFESTDDWITEGTYDQWELGTPSSPNILGANSGSNAWATNLGGIYQTNAQELLYTPFLIIPMSPDTAELSFFMTMHVSVPNAYGTLEYSLDGINWGSLGFINGPGSSNWYNYNKNGQHVWSLTQNTWTQSTHELDPAIFNTGTPFQFRFRFNAGTNTASSDGWAIDDFSIILPPTANDVRVSAILQPTNSTQIGSSNSVEVSIENLGTATQVSIPIGYQLNGSSAPVTEIWTGSLIGGNTTNFTFSTPYVAPNTTHNLCAWTALSNDTYTSNDTNCTSIAVTAANYDVGIINLELEDLHFANYNPITDSIINPHEYSIKVEIENYGIQDVSNIPIEITLNGNTLVNEISAANLQAQSSGFYTFSYQLIAPLGTNNLCAKTVLTTDADPSNDEYCNVYHGKSSGVGVNETENEFFFSLLPNPSNGKFTLNANGIVGDVNVDIMSVNGQLIFSEVIESLNSSTIVKGYDLSAYAKGVYFMRLTNKAGVRTERVVIQ